MATLVHEHPLVRESVDSKTVVLAPHIDSWGKPFGAEEHAALADNLQFAEGMLVSHPTSHKHKHIEEVIEEPSKLRAWRYRPPSQAEAEREITASPVLQRGASTVIEEEEDFPV